MIKFLIILSMLNGYYEENYREIFSDHYETASCFLDGNKLQIDSLAQIYEVDNGITTATKSSKYAEYLLPEYLLTLFN